MVTKAVNGTFTALTTLNVPFTANDRVGTFALPLK